VVGGHAARALGRVNGVSDIAVDYRACDADALCSAEVRNGGWRGGVDREHKRNASLRRSVDLEAGTLTRLEFGGAISDAPY
jgi:hypothetical protein